MVANSRKSNLLSTLYQDVVPTVFSVGGGGGYVTRKDTPYYPYDSPYVYERDLHITPKPAPTPVLEPRQAQFPTFASQCMGDANRLSSACTCLIGHTYTPHTTTIARTAVGRYQTIGVCDPRNDYDLRPSYQGDFEPVGQYANPKFGQQVRSDIKDVQGCCKACYHTPKWCVVYPFLFNHAKADLSIPCSATFSLDPNTNIHPHAHEDMRVCPKGPVNPALLLRTQTLKENLSLVHEARKAMISQFFLSQLCVNGSMEEWTFVRCQFGAVGMISKVSGFVYLNT
ncbi:MAG: hypothetical protein Q9182_006694 [Xanthomendoza sp. 2 TL-2023]